MVLAEPMFLARAAAPRTKCAPPVSVAAFRAAALNSECAGRDGVDVVPERELYPLGTLSVQRLSDGRAAAATCHSLAGRFRSDTDRGVRRMQHSPSTTCPSRCQVAIGLLSEGLIAPALRSMIQKRANARILPAEVRFRRAGENGDRCLTRRPSP